jgi:hypothetical protein
VYEETNKTTIDSAILKVKNRSSRNGGNGNTIIAKISTMKIGIASIFKSIP